MYCTKMKFLPQRTVLFDYKDPLSCAVQENKLSKLLLLLQMALQPGVGLGLRYNMPPGLSVPCSISPFVYTHLSMVHGHVIQPSHSRSSSSSCCIELSVQHLFFWDCGAWHSFYMPKPSYSLAFNKPDNVLSLDYCF